MFLRTHCRTDALLTEESAGIERRDQWHQWPDGAGFLWVTRCRNGSGRSRAWCRSGASRCADEIARRPRRRLGGPLADGGCLVRPFDIAVQQHDVVLDHHVHPRYVEALLDRAQHRSHSVRERVIVDVRIRTATEQPVQHTVPAPTAAGELPPEKCDHCHTQEDDRNETPEFPHGPIVATWTLLGKGPSTLPQRPGVLSTET